MPRYRWLKTSAPVDDVPGSRAQGWIAAALIALCFVINAAAGVAGRDFGEVHWDEPMVLGNARYVVNTGKPLPRHYMHPAASVLLLAAVIPDLAWDRVPARETEADRKPALLRARSLFSIVTATTILAAALAAFARRRSPVEAALAAAIVAGSFELSAHGRFLVPDGMLTAATSWALCAAVYSLRRPRLLWVAAAFAGLAASTKYSGVIVLGAPLIAAVLAADRRPARIVGVVVVGFVAFALTTPGIIVEPRLVIGAFRYQQNVYADGFFGYSVDGWLRHGVVIAQLIATALPSHIAAIALTWAFLGAAAFLLEARRMRKAGGFDPWLVIIVGFAAAWAVVFWRHPAHFARNFLPLIPVIAVLAARGGIELTALMAPRAARGTFLVLFMLSALSIGDVVSAAMSIKSKAQPVVDLLEFVDIHEDEMFLTSPAVAESLLQVDGEWRRNLVTGAAAPVVATRLIAFPGELLSLTRWGGSDTFLADEVFGPRDINWNLYPTWGGPRRAVVMKIEKARALGANMDFEARPEVPIPPPLPDELIKIELPRLEGHK